MKPFRKVLSVILAACLMMVTVGTAAVAFEADYIAPSDKLDVYLRTTDGDTLIHTYSMGEMQSLSNGTDVHYSGIDAMPATVQSVANGVYLEDFLNDLGQYTSYDVWNCKYLRTKSTDNASGVYELDDIFHTTRYYFEDIHGAGGGINEDGEVNCPAGTGTPVPPMIAVSGLQQRLPVPSGEGRNTDLASFTFLFGMTEDEVAYAVNRVNEYKRGIHTLIIDMGDTGAKGSGTTVPVEITGVSLDRTSLTLGVSKNFQLTAITEPSNATDSAVTWRSSDTTVAKVSSTGVVTGVKEGEADITVTSAANAGLSAVCTVTVIQNEIAPTSIKLDSAKLTLLTDAEKSLALTVYPSNATYKAVSWKSSDTKVATVDGNGKVRALAAGTAVITVTITDTADKELSATCAVTVTDEIIAPEAIGLNRSLLRLKPGDDYQMKLTLEPEDASAYTALWGSSSPSIAAVDTEGKLTAKNTGVAVITVNIDGTGLTASCTVTVSGDGVSFNDSEGHWASDSIKTMAEHGFINGYDDGSFKPQASISRAEFVTILIRVLQDARGAAISGGNAFADTEAHWAKLNISTAVKLELLGGYGDGRFGPDDFVTREQIAVMLINAVGGNFDGTKTQFADNADISSWAKEKVGAAAGLGFINGYEDGSFKPQNNATRAEVCAVLLRFYEHIAQ